MTTTCSPRHSDARMGKYRRTNSLAFAKSDCHNCSALGLNCDRQRPRCSTCQDASVLCQGYSMQLTWRSNHSTTNKPSKTKRKTPAERGDAPKQKQREKASSSENIDFETASLSPSTREYMFVTGRPAKRRRQNQPTSGHGSGRNHPVVDQGVNASRNPDSPPQPSHEQVQTQTSEASHHAEPIGFRLDLSETLSSISPPSHILNLSFPSPSDPWNQIGLDWSATLPGHPTTETPDNENIEQCLQIQQQPFGNHSAEWTSQTAESLEWNGNSNCSSSSSSDEGEEDASSSGNAVQNNRMLNIPPQMVFSTLYDKFYVLLDMYDQEFCKYPVTSDFCVNPYRYRPETTKGSRHLLHAIMAVACHFRQRTPAQLTPPTDTIDHKNMAMTLYQSAMSGDDLYINGLSLLDTMLALWQAEATISALNIWRSHLTDTYNLLEVCGGIKRWSRSMRTHIQVSMILWWDTMVSLLSREKSVLPYTYLEAVLKSEGRQPWTFYELNGCPRELFVPMTQLASLAAQEKGNRRRSIPGRRKSDDNTATVPHLVAEIELSIRSYEYPGGGLSDLLDPADEEALQAERDRYHCCEAFRYSLLIYILRIFTLPRDGDGGRDGKNNDTSRHVRARLSLLSRVALDHIAACRATSVIQKQLLFAVFIAGAEARTRLQRDLVGDYCRRWYRKFGYQMYNVVLDVVEAVWTEHDAGNQDFWWGEELDARRAREGDYVQFCFG